MVRHTKIRLRLAGHVSVSVVFVVLKHVYKLVWLFRHGPGFDHTRKQ